MLPSLLDANFVAVFRLKGSSMELESTLLSILTIQIRHPCFLWRPGRKLLDLSKKATSAVFFIFKKGNKNSRYTEETEG